MNEDAPLRRPRLSRHHAGWLLLPAALAVGWLTGWLLPEASHALLRLPAALYEVLRFGMEWLGIAFIGLIPLAFWLLRLALRYAVRGADATEVTVLDLAFISRNGPLLGLLGTIVALAAAGSQLAADVRSGDNTAILNVFPLLSQTLLSSIAGIVLAIGADITLHCIERKAARNAPLPEVDTEQ